LFVFSIGVNDYDQPLVKLENCITDAELITEKIIQDFRVRWEKAQVSPGKITSFTLTDKEATYSSIKAVFDSIAKKSGPHDYFVFFFGGISLEDPAGSETVMIPFTESIIDSFPYSPNAITLNMLSKWMEPVQCQRQLIISEAGNGKSFGMNLIRYLFEADPILASESNRERIIITTNGMGLDSRNCSNQGMQPGGPLVYFLSQVDNIFSIFNESARFEYDLMRIEMDCNLVFQELYSKVYYEKDFNHLLALRSNFAGVYRGPKTRYLTDDIVANNNPGISNYALIIGTNKYNDNPDWDDLRNPVNDATEIESILRNKYGFHAKTLINQPRDSILLAIIDYKEKLQENDNLLIFIAGHGYFDEDYSDGFIVTVDSKPLNSDFGRDSYLQMAKMNRLIDNLPSRKIFILFDICFGAHFDFNARDLSLSDYGSDKSDISVDDLIERKKDYYSRIYLASGKGEVPDYWLNTLRHSPFAAKLIDVLKNESEFITPGKIFRSMERNITEPVLKEFGKHEPRGDFILKVDN